LLARAAERREWLSRPLGEPPHYRDLDGPAARAVIASFLDREPAGGWLSLAEAEALLATHGIPVVASHHCRDLERAVAVAAQIGAPVALKADFVAPAHASDIDAVMLALENESAVRSGVESSVNFGRQHSEAYSLDRDQATVQRREKRRKSTAAGRRETASRAEAVVAVSCLNWCVS
jgi:acetyltransferase